MHSLSNIPAGSIDSPRVSLLEEAAGRPGTKLPALQLKRENLFLQFHISLNEEHCSLIVSDDSGWQLNLGERVHHYTLLTLARERLADMQHGIERYSQGWIEMDRLSRMLGLDVAHLNIQIFRARRQIAKEFPISMSLPDIVERRRREVRLAAVQVHIMRV